MANDERRRLTDSEDDPNFTYKDLVKGGRLWALILFFIACVLAIFVFWRFGHLSANMLAVTEYVIEVPADQERVFGYGGLIQTPDPQLKSYAKVDVPFQSRAMSSLCFAISRGNDGTYKIKGLEDRIWIGGRPYESKQEVALGDGARFKTEGRFGSAVFIAHLEEQPNQVRLELATPLHYRISSQEMRLSLGLFNEMVGAPIDELFVRTALRDSQVESFKIIKSKERGGYFLEWEEDLARPEGARSEVLESLLNSSNEGTPAREAFFETGVPHKFGTVRVNLTGQSGSRFWGIGPASVFGFKLGIALLLLAILFGLQRGRFARAQIRMLGGPVIFGAVSLLAVVGLTLAARDYFLPPYNQGRFSEYLKWFLRASMILYFIRVPRERFFKWEWLISLPVFLGLFAFLNRPFEGWLSLPSLFSLGGFIFEFFFFAFLIHFLLSFTNIFVKQSLGLDWWRGLAYLLGAIAVVFSVTWLWGGREAMMIRGMRVHLPTLLLPLVVMGTCLAVVTAERNDNWRLARNLAIGIMFFVAGFYYVFSGRGFSGGDHGGTLVLSFGVIAAMWAAARRSRPWVWTGVLVALFAVALFFAAVVFQHERMNIAWGGEEGAGRYFDAAVNLRTGRDLARSGGFWGDYDSLYVPISVSTNIHNDLATAYVAGFFGLIGLGLVALAYYFTYTRLLDGLVGLGSEESAAKNTGPPQQGNLAKSKMPDLFEVRRVKSGIGDGGLEEDALRMWKAFGLSMTRVLLFQLLWVFTATLLPLIPFSGLDLQPISASVISILGFMILLLGSVAWVHNLYQSEKERAQA